jgi:hypothetical protein
MKIENDEIHDTLVATYQSIEGSILNRVLIKNGVSDLELRREIVSSFLFEQGVLLDQCWFEEDEKKWYPGVFFSTAPHDKSSGAILHLPSEQYGMNFHEYAHGAADWALENDTNEDAIKIGNVWS